MSTRSTGWQMVEQLVGEVVGKYDVELDLADKVVEGLT